MHRYLLLLLSILTVSGLAAQNLTGIWKGTFTTGIGEYKRIYNYEIHIRDNGQKHIYGVAYSYLSQDFFGKTSLTGHVSASGHILLQEKNVLQLKPAKHTDICLMLSELVYYRAGNKEHLEGAFTSAYKNTREKCSSGSVSLQKTLRGSFPKEAFLLPPRKNKATVKARKQRMPQPPAQPITAADSNKTAINPPPRQEPQPTTDTIPPAYPVPAILQTRKNRPVRTIITSDKSIDIELYDNGEVDDDTLSIYHNNREVLSHQRLSHQPIRYHIEASDSNRIHTLIMVAENLGKIPPNTALMVIKTGGKRYEIFIESDMGNNGLVEIDYRPSN